MLADVWKSLSFESVAAAHVGRHELAWAKLSHNAQEPSCMQLPDMQLPLLAENQDAKLLTIRQYDELLLALPVQPARKFYCSTASDFTCSSLPLVSNALSQEAVLAFTNQLERPLLLRDLPIDSRFYRQLRQASGQLSVLNKWQRASLKVVGDFDTWFADNFDKKRRKEFKRLRNRLAEQGVLKLETLNQSSDFSRYVDDFMELESRGWKGKRGTAIKAQAEKSSAFHNICEKLHANGRLRFWILRFNGHAIAALFGIVSGSQAQIVKIAYDENFAKYSPGVLLVLDATEAFFAEPGLEMVDSCAIPDHPMINRIWRDRLAFADVLVAPVHYPTWKFQNLFIGLSLDAKLRALAKTTYLILTRKKKS